MRFTGDFWVFPGEGEEINFCFSSSTWSRPDLRMTLLHFKLIKSLLIFSNSNFPQFPIWKYELLYVGYGGRDAHCSICGKKLKNVCEEMKSSSPELNEMYALYLDVEWSFSVLNGK